MTRAFAIWTFTFLYGFSAAGALFAESPIQRPICGVDGNPLPPKVPLDPEPCCKNKCDQKKKPCTCSKCCPQPCPQPVMPQQPEGDLAFGGGSFIVPLPTLQFPRFFRTPAVRTSAVAVTQPVTSVASVGAVSSAAVIPTVPVAASVHPIIPVASAAVVAPPVVAAAASDAPVKKPCEEEQLRLLLQLLMMKTQASSAAASAAAAPADNVELQKAQEEVKALSKEINELREVIQQLQELKGKQGSYQLQPAPVVSELRRLPVDDEDTAAPVPVVIPAHYAPPRRLPQADPYYQSGQQYYPPNQPYYQPGQR